ncbi:MAG: prealbumin-like fold domain-containing protein, partial [Clostridiales bacterium]|nr:prealbumin-like fold domain-containing protein [Clostridiales bacterium]
MENMLKPKRILSLILSVLMFAQSIPIQSLASMATPASADPAGMVTQTLRLTGPNSVVSVPDGSATLSVKASISGDEEDAADVYAENDAESAVLAVGVDRLLFTDEEGDTRFLEESEYALTDITVAEDSEARDYRVYYTDSCDTPITGYVTETSFEGNTAEEKTYTLPEGTVSVYVAYADKGDGDLEYSVHADVYLMESGSVVAYSYFYDPTGLFDTANNVSASYAALPQADAMREKDAEIFGKTVLRSSDDFTVYHADTMKPVLYSSRAKTANYLNGWTVTANWFDGTTDYTWNAVEDDTQKPTIVVEYKVENASVQYDPGDIVITVPGIGQSGRTSDFIMSTTTGSGISEWSCEYDSSTNTYTFTNLFTVAAGVSTSGGFQMSWTINARDSVSGYTMADNPTFSLGSDSITLPELTYSFTSTTDLYRIDLTYDSGEVWVPSAADDIESYMWGYAVVRYDKDILSRGLQQWKNTFTITVPSGVTADDIEFYSDAGTKVTLTKVSSTQYACTVEGSDAIIGDVNETLETRVYIGIKKSALGSNDTVTIATHLDRLYLDENTWITTARTNEIVDDSVTITLTDYSFDWNGYIYSTEKYSEDYEQEDHSAPSNHENRLPATAVFNNEEVMFILKGYANCQIITSQASLASYSLNSGISTASVEESSNENTGIVLFSASGEEEETASVETESEAEETVTTVTSVTPSFSKASALTPESGITLLSLTSGSTVYYADKHPESAGNTTGVTKLEAYDYWYMFLGDDKLAVVLRDGSIRNLTDDEYDITKVYPSEDNWEIYAAKSQDTPFAEYEFIDSGDTASSAVSLPDGYKAVFVLYKNRVDGFEIEQQTAITVKFHLDWAEEEAKATAKQIDPEQRIINYNLFRAMYTESDGTLANDCAASSSNYGGSYGTSLAARDKNLYDEYFLRSYSHVWLREIPVRYYAATEISDFTETEEDQYQATITAMGYLQSAESGIVLETFSMYSEVPDGLLIDDISLDTITFGDSSLAKHATVELIENNGKQYIAVHFDYSGSPINISDLKGFSFTYNVYENGTSLAANAHQYTSYTYIMIDDEGPKSVTGGNIMADYYDIDSDGDTTELMGYGADIQLIQEDLDEWRQYVEKHVQSYYSNGYVTSTSTKLYDGNETEKSEYSYRLAFALGSNGAKNIVLYDNIETGASIAKNAATPNIYTDIDTEWNGKFLSVDTSYAESMGFTVTVYYSADKDAPFDITDSAWSTTKPSTVRSIAAALDTSGFTNGVFSSKNVVYVIVNMQAPSDSSLVGDVAVNQYYAVYDSYNPSTGSSLNTSYSLPSSETYVVLNDSPGKLELIKVDINTREPLAGAAFNIYDSDKSLLYQGVRTDTDGTINIELNPGTYYWEETEAPEGYVRS